MTYRHKTTQVVLGACLALAGLCLAARSVEAHDWLGDCVVDFDHSFALTYIYGQARGNFGSSTGMNAAGDLEVCDPSTHSACWTYRHRCFNNYINVEDMTYGHIHLVFDSPSLLAPCFSDPGDGYGAGYGRPVGNGCVAADWIHEPRTLGTHAKDHWIKIWMEDRVTHQPRVFDMPIIRVAGTEPIQFWFRKNDGSWWYWSNLAPNPWLVGGWVYDVTEVRIRGAQAANGPYFIGAFLILD
ncbi:MAG: hypothetical protein NBKEAIPA_03385 [Nitrospirae bacterium]|nr:MAG: hypothetical protein UZ03_NOB001002599 [Nitrospira sp. OLB3]MBV6471453.1 hypothetical protein [Nitrospirota bacterium]MCK6492165.1 hypothetical protein [Nitrospira sp.]MEB2339402.1 hypothetical protein [Nitrospirales bacterium]RIK60969.1 MAG: hypothetical protein DCC63_02090 [Nitrospira sp.]